MDSWRKIISLRRVYERKYRRPIYRAFMDQLNEVLGELNEGTVSDFDKKITLENNKNLEILSNKIYADVGWGFYRRFKRTKDLERSLWDESFVSYLELHTGTRIKDINAYTQEILRKLAREIITEGTEQGLGIYEIERMLRKEMVNRFGAFSRSRATRIVQTEVMTASNLSTLYAGENSGLIMRKVWLVAPGGVNKTERHRLIWGLGDQRPMKGQYFDVDGTPMLAPGDPGGGAQNVINCKCCLAWEQMEI